MPHAVFTAFAALIVGAAFSATSYVVPWYVNPALRAQVRLGDEAPRVTSLALDPTGASLALGAEANGAFENIQAYKVAELAAATGVVTNGFTGRLASAAAVPSSSSEQLHTSIPVSSAKAVWKISRASIRPCEISA